MKKLSFLFFLPLSLCCIEPSIYIEKPVTKKTSVDCSDQSTNNKEEMYLFARSCIEQGKYRRAIKWLLSSLEIDPNFYKSRLQLGYLYIWRKEFRNAEKNLLQILAAPSKGETMQALEVLAKEWQKEPCTSLHVARIYEKLVSLSPNNSDYLLYLGKAYADMEKWKEAEKTLLQGLSLTPEYFDIELLLVRVYASQKKWQKAEALLVKHINDPIAKKRLAFLYLEKKDLEKAQMSYEKLKKEFPDDEEIHHRLGQVYILQNKFSLAKKEYLALTKKNSQIDPLYFRDLFAIRSHTDYSLYADSTYTASKENDPNLGQPTVRDFYFNNSLTLFIPIYDTWRLNVKGVGGYQKERNIYNNSHATNYNVCLAGGIVGSDYFLPHDWKWNVNFGLINGSNIGHNLAYPFETVTKPVGGTSFTYRPENHIFLVDCHEELFLIKDFSTVTSKLLSLTYLDSLYRYTIPMPTHPEFEGYVEETLYSDNIHNKRNAIIFAARVHLPFLSECFMPYFQFERRAFCKLNPNYYSYKRQFRYLLGLNFHKEFIQAGYFDIYYFHRWQRTLDLFQPIGDFLFITPEQNLHGNKIEGVLGYRYKDPLRIEVGAHYFRDSLPYRDWNVYGNLLWEF